MEEDDLLNLLLLLLLVTYYNSRRESNYLTRSAVVLPHDSPWTKLLHNGDNMSFLNLSGMTKYAFYKLEGILFSNLDYRKRGRPPILDSFGQLGLYLFFVGSTMSTKFICLIFGIIPSSANSIIDKMRKLICEKLSDHHSSKVTWPTTEEMEVWASLIHDREPTVNCVIGFCDGVAIHIQCNDSEEEQSKSYNGHTKDTMCNNVFAFSPTGKIFYAARFKI